AARKLARMIAQKQLARPAFAEARAVEGVAEAGPTGAKSRSGSLQLDPLENLLDQELRKYGISLG
ncbi:MAG TPA: hypothetical protein VIW22_05930, partial [Nitrososphaerales archaeon]